MTEKLFKYSFIFLKGTKAAFDEGLDALRSDSYLDSLLYLKIKNTDKSEFFEPFSVSTNVDIEDEISFFTNQYISIDWLNEIKGGFENNKVIIKKIDEKGYVSGVSIFKYFLNKKIVIIPCYDESKFSGFLCGFFDMEKNINLSLLKNVSELVARACESVSSLIEMRKSELKYKAILENIEDGYFEIDLAGNLKEFNDVICRISGLPRKELLGINNRDYTSGETSKNMFRVFSEIYKTNIPLKIKDYEVILKDGEKRWLELSASLMKNQKGEPQGFRGLVRDVTAKKKGEFERKMLEEKLNQSQRLEAVGTLAGGIAHDFNNLLMAIQGNASLIITAAKGNKIVNDKAKSIEKCVESGANLTRQLLGFARGGKYIARPCNINRVIEASLVMFSRAHKELTIETDLDSKLDLVEADQSQLEQVLMNLYLNAWHAMDGTGKIKIITDNVYLSTEATSLHELSSGNYIVIKVEDNGCGMDEDVKKRIFEPFFTTKEKGRGTGLGLASVFGIVKNHDGFINVSSKLGKGSCFNLFFPAVNRCEEEFEEKTDSVSLATKVRSVLLVDDEKSILEVGAAMLDEIGCKVITAAGGHEAVAIFREKNLSIDLVILDMVMPDLDGIGTYKELKKINNNVRVLFSSGYLEEEQYKKDYFEENIGRAFISKPYNLSALTNKIHELTG